MSSLRILILGGLFSYRALFGWLSPWVAVPTFLVAPIAQILLFAYLGRSAGLADDGFYVVGNALLYSAIPCVFAMGNTIGGERQQQTLELLLATPARRTPLFLGRALPVIVNGFLVSGFALVAGAAILHVRLPLHAAGGLVLALAVSAYSCTGIGLVTAALALRVRETAVLANVVYGVLLVFCGVNVPLRDLPHWMANIAPWLPLTHGIRAAQHLLTRTGAAGAPRVSWDLAVELGVGSAYLVMGLIALRLLETESRHRASLSTM